MTLHVPDHLKELARRTREAGAPTDFLESNIVDHVSRDGNEGGDRERDADAGENGVGSGLGHGELLQQRCCEHGLWGNAPQHVRGACEQGQLDVDRNPATVDGPDDDGAAA